MDQFPRWFTNKKLNFTKNLLYPNKHHQRQPHTIAVHFRSELDQLSRSITWQELREQVQVARKVLKNKFGIVKGDIIGAYAHNCPEVLVYMLAGASLGAIFTSGSPDFGPTVNLNLYKNINVFIDNYNYKYMFRQLSIDSVRLNRRFYCPVTPFITMEKFMNILKNWIKLSKDADMILKMF